MTTTVFLCGPLADGALRQALLGEPAVRAATLRDAALVGAAARPALVARPGGAVPGLLAELTDEALARLCFWQADRPGEVWPVDAPGATPARVWWDADASPAAAAADWDARAWMERWRDTVVAAVPDVLMHRGHRPAPQVLARWPQILTRAGARVRAAAAGPVTLRHDATAGDVAVERHFQPYAHYFAVDEYDLRFRRFDGTLSQTLNRAVFISGDAVVVLPYDPRTDRVLVIEQFRAGPLGRGDPQPWLIEAIAGRIDGGETPDSSARREAIEEAGLTLGTLHKVADYYPSPAAKAEYIYSFVGMCDLSDASVRHGGLPGEGEDIRAHVLTFGQLMDLVASGEVTNAPLLLCAYWLSAHRARLRSAAGA